MLNASAATYALPEAGDNIIGEIQQVQVARGDTLATLAHEYDVGYYELLEANPDTRHAPLSAGQWITLPLQHILPDTPHRGIIINLAEMRLFYFPPGQHEVMTFPVGIGRQGWQTPEGKMRIVQKREKPTWHVPESIRKARLEEGVVLPKFVLPGPNNPLGEYALRLSAEDWSYLIHGTNSPHGVGRRSSSGCIRMYAADIEQLFQHVALDTPVRIINEPFKAGRLGEELFLEVHEPLQEQASQHGLDYAIGLIKHFAKKYSAQQIDWHITEQIVNQQSGIPSVISHWQQSI
jgi:L,D-transpeptidase ErfK/SrfK